MLGRQYKYITGIQHDPISKEYDSLIIKIIVFRIDHVEDSNNPSEFMKFIRNILLLFGRVMTPEAFGELSPGLRLELRREALRILVESARVTPDQRRWLLQDWAMELATLDFVKASERGAGRRNTPQENSTHPVP
jgi:hypothetical protein